MSESRSLRKLIVWRVLVIALLYTGCLFIVVDTEIGTLLAQVRSNILTSRLWEVGSYLGKDAHQRPALNMPQVRTEFFAQPGVDFVIRGQDGKILFNSPANYVDYTPPKVPERDKIYEFEFAAPDGSIYMGQSGWITFDRVPYLVQVTQGKNVAAEFSDKLGRKFLYNVVLLAIPFVALLIFAIMMSIRQSLAPVKASSQEAQAITFAVPGRRLQSANLPEEIKPLVDAFNTVLERLEAGIIAQKEFTAHAAHELRTPLTILQTHIALLEDADLKKKLSTDVDAMGRMVEQLLAAARLEDSDKLVMDRCDLVRIVRDVCFAMWPLMLKQSVRLDVTGVENPVWINGNADSISRALRNILENALHYAPKGSAVTVDISGAKVGIRDHGPGIAPEDRERIFDRFWRKDQRQSGGAGLGLYIVRTTMKLHGGSVTVEAPDGGGALFVLTFPG
ncbi:MAG: sensor histidine kinase [Alphaproteobacteria bacterium]